MPHCCCWWNEETWKLLTKIMIMIDVAWRFGRSVKMFLYLSLENIENCKKNSFHLFVWKNLMASHKQYRQSVWMNFCLGQGGKDETMVHIFVSFTLSKKRSNINELYWHCARLSRFLGKWDWKELFSVWNGLLFPPYEANYQISSALWQYDCFLSFSPLQSLIHVFPSLLLTVPFAFISAIDFSLSPWLL